MNRAIDNATLAETVLGPVPDDRLGHVGTDPANQGQDLALVMSRMCLAGLRDRGVGECLIAPAVGLPVLVHSAGLPRIGIDHGRGRLDVEKESTADHSGAVR